MFGDKKKKAEDPRITAVYAGPEMMNKGFGLPRDKQEEGMRLVYASPPFRKPPVTPVPGPKTVYPYTFEELDDDEMTMKVCSKCGAGNPMAARYCVECGAAFPKPKSACPYCGAPNLMNWKYCINCGKPLKKDLQENQREILPPMEEVYGGPEFFRKNPEEKA